LSLKPYYNLPITSELPFSQWCLGQLKEFFFYKLRQLPKGLDNVNYTYFSIRLSPIAKLPKQQLHSKRYQSTVMRWSFLDLSTVWGISPCWLCKMFLQLFFETFASQLRLKARCNPSALIMSIDLTPFDNSSLGRSFFWRQ